MKALFQAALNPLPFGIEYGSRDNVKGPFPVDIRAVALDSESDTGSSNCQFSIVSTLVKFADAGFAHKPGKFTETRARPQSAVKDFVISAPRSTVTTYVHELEQFFHQPIVGFKHAEPRIGPVSRVIVPFDVESNTAGAFICECLVFDACVHA